MGSNPTSPSMRIDCDHPELASSTAYNKKGCRCLDCVDDKRDAVLRSRYGIGIDDYHLLWAKQKGRCGCCGKKFNQRAHIDHDHQTGEVRGLLCQACNTGIGKLGDDIRGVAKALTYLIGDQ